MSLNVRICISSEKKKHDVDILTQKKRMLYDFKFTYKYSRTRLYRGHLGTS
jgi:hypothetical protein